jgi:hypothetical protein
MAGHQGNGAESIGKRLLILGLGTTDRGWRGAAEILVEVGLVMVHGRFMTFFDHFLIEVRNQIKFDFDPAFCMTPHLTFISQNSWCVNTLRGEGAAYGGYPTEKPKDR